MYVWFHCHEVKLVLQNLDMFLFVGCFAQLYFIINIKKCNQDVAGDFHNRVPILDV